MCLCGLQFPKTIKGDFNTKDEKCLASNGMTCVLPLSPIYAVTSFATAKDIWITYVILIVRMILHLSISCNMKKMP